MNFYLICDWNLVFNAFRMALEDQSRMVRRGTMSALETILRRREEAFFVVIVPHLTALAQLLSDEHRGARRRTILVAGPNLAVSSKNLFSAGLGAIVHIDDDLDQLTQAIHSVVAGDAYASPLARRMAESERTFTDAANLREKLNTRELQILRLISLGLSNRIVGERLSLSEKTVKYYVTGLFEKLNVSNRVAAAAVYLREFGDAPSTTDNPVSEAENQSV